MPGHVQGGIAAFTGLTLRGRFGKLSHPFEHGQMLLLPY